MRRYILMGMQESAVGSFFKFAIGFMVLVSVSLGVTVAVNVYTEQQGAEQQTAAALQAMLVQQK